MKRLLLPALLLALAANPAFAKGDAAKGKQLAYTCSGCHGIDQYKNAYPSYRVPKIAGQSPTYIVNALKAYQSGERSHPSMRGIAASLNEETMKQLAEYYGGTGK